MVCQPATRRVCQSESRIAGTASHVGGVADDGRPSRPRSWPWASDERPPFQPRVDDRPERRARGGVALRALERVGQRSAGCLGVGDEVVELGQLFPSQPHPGRLAAGAVGEQLRDLGEREPDVAEQKHEANLADRFRVVSTLPALAPDWPDEPQFVVVAQRRGRHPGALGQLADREHLTSSVLEVVRCARDSRTTEACPGRRGPPVRGTPRRRWPRRGLDHGPARVERRAQPVGDRPARPAAHRPAAGGRVRAWRRAGGGGGAGGCGRRGRPFRR